MRTFLCIALFAFLYSVAVQSYGPKIYYKHHRPVQKSSHGWIPSHHHQAVHESHRSLSHESQHGWSHSSRYRPPYDYYYERHYGHFRPPPWYYSGESEESRPDFSDSSKDSDESDNFGSYEDYGDWYYHFHTTKRPCKRPTKIPDITEATSTTTEQPQTPPHTYQPWMVLPHKHTTPELTETIWTMITNRTNPAPTTTEPASRPSRTVDSSPSTGPTKINLHPDRQIEETTTLETTTSLPVTTSTVEEEEEIPTISPEIQSCIDSCISTPEFLPVCGSNGETYDNEGKLFCAKSCGVNVSLRRRSICPPPFFDFADEGPPPPPPPPTTTTSRAITGRTTPLSSFQRCMRQCRITASFTPVCGTNLITYMNMDRFKCAQKCGEDVEVLCEKPCAACGATPVRTTSKITTTMAPTTAVTFGKITMAPTTAGHFSRITTTPTTAGNFGRITMAPDTQECTKKCPVTFEFNPVCGTDYVTYKNPGHLLCAQLCGVRVFAAQFSTCPPTSTSSTTTEQPDTELPPVVRNCILSCRVTSQYDPVCGTDGYTYPNLGNLECAKFCGVDVDMKHKSRCEGEFDIFQDDDSTTRHTTQDINGDKGVTTSLENTASTSSLLTSPTTQLTTIVTTSLIKIPRTTLVTKQSTTPSTTTTTMPTTTPSPTPTITTTTITDTPTSTSTRTTSRITLPTTTSSTTPITTLTTSPVLLSTPTVAPRSNSTLNFTIPLEILNDIFGSATNESSSTTKDPDSDEDIDLDSRFSNDNDSRSNNENDRIIFPE